MRFDIRPIVSGRTAGDRVGESIIESDNAGKSIVGNDGHDSVVANECRTGCQIADIEIYSRASACDGKRLEVAVQLECSIGRTEAPSTRAFDQASLINRSTAPLDGQASKLDPRLPLDQRRRPCRIAGEFISGNRHRFDDAQQVDEVGAAAGILSRQEVEAALGKLPIGLNPEKFDDCFRFARFQRADACGRGIRGTAEDLLIDSNDLLLADRQRRIVGKRDDDRAELAGDDDVAFVDRVVQLQDANLTLAITCLDFTLDETDVGDCCAALCHDFPIPNAFEDASEFITGN